MSSCLSASSRKARLAAVVGVAGQRVDRRRPGLALEQHLVDFEPGEIRRFVARQAARDDVDAEHLRGALEPRGDVHLVADGGIVETAGRAEVADAAFAGVEADAELDL